MIGHYDWSTAEHIILSEPNRTCLLLETLLSQLIMFGRNVISQEKIHFYFLRGSPQFVHTI